MKNIDVAILGATGIVGQKFIELLSDHPYFRVNELFASEKSAGKTLEETAVLQLTDKTLDSIRNIKIKNISQVPQSMILFSALPGDIAAETELRNAKSGKIVISKASALRYEQDVPILIPEINSTHLEILKIQKKNRNSKGCVITDPNCTTAIIALSLAPLMHLGIDQILITTMQAISGAGLPGVAALRIQDNIIPYIDGEEEKILQESKKILGTLKNGKIKNASFKMFASANRVPVVDGHCANVHIRFKDKIDLDKIANVLSNFSSVPQKLDLPLAPKQPIILRKEPDRPQPRLDRDNGKGMAITVGRLRKGIDENSIAYSVCGHNLIRGAAGAGILDAELLVKTNKIEELTG